MGVNHLRNHTQERRNAQSVSDVGRFYLNFFLFVGYRNNRVFLPTQILIFRLPTVPTVIFPPCATWARTHKSHQAVINSPYSLHLAHSLGLIIASGRCVSGNVVRASFWSFVLDTSPKCINREGQGLGKLAPKTYLPPLVRVAFVTKWP